MAAFGVVGLVGNLASMLVLTRSSSSCAPTRSCESVSGC